MSKTYEILEGGTGIVCLVCGMPSYNPEDVRRRFCGHCRAFHDDLEKQQPATPELEQAPPEEDKPVKKKKESVLPPPARSIAAKFGRKSMSMGRHFTRRRLY